MLVRFGDAQLRAVSDLQHSFLTGAYRRRRDLRAVAELALHSDLRTTQRYAEAAVSETARKAIEQMDESE